MSNLTDFFSSGGGYLSPLDIKLEVYTSDATFVAPYSGYYVVILSGGGAGGTDGSSTAGGVGGGGSGVLIKTVNLLKNENVPITIGQGGLHGIPGGAGGTTSFGTYASALGASGRGGAQCGGSGGGAANSSYNGTSGGSYILSTSIISNLNLYNNIIGTYGTNVCCCGEYLTWKGGTNNVAGGGGGAGFLGNGGDATHFDGYGYSSGGVGGATGGTGGNGTSGICIIAMKGD